MFLPMLLLEDVISLARPFLTAAWTLLNNEECERSVDQQ